MVSFADILAPVSPSQFEAEFFDRRPLWLAGDPRRCGALLTVGDVERWLAFPHLLGALDPRLARGRASRAPALEDGTVDARATRAALERGDTLVLDFIETLVAPVADLCRDVVATLGCRAWANAYFCLGPTQGFEAHEDPHDALFLQLEGAKTWRLWPPRGSSRPPDTGIVLRAGDVLHVPRGWVHEGVAGAAGSLHLTLTLQPCTWADLLRAFDRTVPSNPEVQRAVPMSDPEGAARHLRELYGADLEARAVAAVLERAWNENLREQRPVAEPGARLSPEECARLVREGTGVEVRDAQRCRVTAGGTRSTIVFGGGGVEGPAAIEPALRFIASRAGAFAADALPGLTRDSSLTLTRWLCREGLLSPVSPWPR